jgi:uncharacterized membrane protein YeaQ/YmgE (transglycosylase-associated protein family)
VVKISPQEIVTWLIVGALAGSLAGMLITRRKEGFGTLSNLAVGLVGAMIGGFLFKILHISLGLLDDITVSLREVVAALVGSLIFLIVIWLVRKKAGKK